MKCVIAVALLCAAAPVLAQTRPAARGRGPDVIAAGQDYVAQAYDEFLRARRLDSADKTDESIAVYKRAMALDPGSAAIPAELADVYFRANRAEDAIATAEQSLKIADNRDAHRVLGLVYAALSDTGRRSGRARPAGPDENVGKAIPHLEAASAGSGGGDPNVRAMLGRLYIRTRAFDKAIPMLNELVNEEPGWDEGPELLAQAYSGAGREADAVKWLEQAAPNDPQLYATLADFYERQRQWDQAAAAYTKVLEIAPKNTDLRTRYASALLNSGARESAARAREVLNDLVAARPNDARTLYLLAQADRRVGDLAASETHARRIIQQNPKSPWGYYALAETLEERRQYQSVVDALAPAVTTLRAADGDDVPELVLLLPHLGFAYRELGQHAKAIAAYEQAHTLAPKDEAISAYLVDANIAAKKYARALEVAREALRDNPGNLRLTRLEAQALQKSGKPAEGAALLEDLVKQRGDEPAVYVALAQFYLGADRGQQAVTLLQDAGRKFPEDTAVAFELGAVYDKLKRYADAEAQFRQIIARDPENAAAMNYLGYMLAERGDRLDESVRILTRALQLEPDNGSYLDSLGWAYFKSDKLDLAEQNLKKAAEQLTTNSVVQTHYGEVLFKLRRYGDAIAAWTRALDGDGEEINPKDINARIRSAREKLGRK